MSPRASKRIIIICTVLGIVFAIVLAARTTATGAESLAWVLLSGIFQLAATMVGFWQRKSTEGVARAATRGLLSIGKQASKAVALAETSQEQVLNLNQLRVAMGQMNIRVSTIEEMAANEIENWREVHKLEVDDVKNSTDSLSKLTSAGNPVRSTTHVSLSEASPENTHQEEGSDVSNPR